MMQETNLHSRPWWWNDLAWKGINSIAVYLEKLISVLSHLDTTIVLVVEKTHVRRTVWVHYDFFPLWPALNVAAVVFFIVTSFPSNPTWSRTNGSKLLVLLPIDNLIDNLCLEAAIFEIQFMPPLKSHYETARSINTIWLHQRYVLFTSGLVCYCN